MVAERDADGGFALTATLPAALGPARGESASLKLARAIVGGLGGELTVEPRREDGRAAIRAVLRAEDDAAGARALRA